MSDSQHQRLRRAAPYLIIAGVVLIVAAVVAVLWLLDNHDGLGLVVRGQAAAWSYLASAALVFADAVIPVFPAETTLTAASTLAAQGKLDLPLVILAGSIGAVLGDSALYWIARRASGLVEDRVQKLRQTPKVATVMAFIGGNEPVMITAGRYVPGMRFVINATMGISRYPFRRFLLWSAVGGLIWSTYTCLLAYWIGSVLSEFPLASVIISGVVTTVALGALFVVMRRSVRERPKEFAQSGQALAVVADLTGGDQATK